MDSRHAATPDDSFDLLRNDPLLDWQRKLRLAPREGRGVLRRALFFALFTWLPIVVWAALNERLLDTATAEPLFTHFGIHVRCLVAIPLFILAEAMAGGVLAGIIAQFRASDTVGDDQQAEFAAVLDGLRRLRDASLPWLCVIGIALAWVFATPVHTDSHDMAWAAEGVELGFGGWWFVYVVRPIFLVLLLGWFWRIALMILLFHRIAKLNLSLVPSHPDRCGGLGFLKKMPMAMFLVTLAVSSVIASSWMHNELYHGQTLASLKAPAAVFVVFWGGLMLSPLLLFAPRIAAMKREALLNYGALVGAHGRLVHQRWILGKRPVPDDDRADILDAPELGPVADISAIYDAVAKVNAVPIGKGSIAMVLIPMALPMLAVISHEIPLRQLLLNLLKTVA